MLLQSGENDVIKELLKPKKKKKSEEKTIFQESFGKNSPLVL